MQFYIPFRNDDPKLIPAIKSVFDNKVKTTDELQPPTQATRSSSSLCWSLRPICPLPRHRRLRSVRQEQQLDLHVRLQNEPRLRYHIVGPLSARKQFEQYFEQRGVSKRSLP